MRWRSSPCQPTWTRGRRDGSGSAGCNTSRVPGLVNALRRRLERDPAKPRYILTEPWVGYRFDDD